MVKKGERKPFETEYRGHKIKGIKKGILHYVLGMRYKANVGGTPMYSSTLQVMHEYIDEEIEEMKQIKKGKIN